MVAYLCLGYPHEPFAVEAGELFEDERDVVEREGLALVEHVEGDAVAVLDVLQHDDSVLGALAREPAEPGKGPRATIGWSELRTFLR